MREGLTDLEGGRDRVATKLLELHSDDGHVLDQAVRWKPARWRSVDLRKLGAHLEAIESASDTDSGDKLLIRRRHVATLDQPEARFLAAMIWGFGPVGYGPTRVSRIATEAGDQLTSSIRGIADAARIGPEPAWKAFTSTHKLKWLGPAFATKVAYLESLAVDQNAPGPLIADLNTSWAMWHFVRLPRSVSRLDSYLTYVEIARQWADEIGCRSDDVEWALFALGQKFPKTLR
ncbi:MAG: 8-oxoguanine DNA glycosylase OGG fold protein [Acidimicrobiales bacterium]